MSERIAILGCGYVGTALARHWKPQGLSLVVTTTTADRLASLEELAGDARLVRGDDPVGLRSLLTGVDTLVVLVGARRGSSYEDTYLRTAETLARVLPDCPSVQQLIYTGSYAVYGDQQGAWVNEDSPLKPVPPNGPVLARVEETLLGLRSPERRVCLLRLGGIYGPGRELARIFGPAAGTTRPGTGEEPGNWVHLEDIVGAIAFARERRLDGLYNLVSEPIASGELLARVCAEAGLAPIRFDPSLPSQRPYHARVSNRKLIEAGYRFRHPRVFE